LDVKKLLRWGTKALLFRYGGGSQARLALPGRQPCLMGECAKRTRVLTSIRHVLLDNQRYPIAHFFALPLSDGIDVYKKYQ